MFQTQGFDASASSVVGNRRFEEVPQTVGLSAQQHRCSSEQSLGGGGEAQGSAEWDEADKQGRQGCTLVC